MSSQLQQQKLPLFRTHSSSQEETWISMFKQLVKYKETNGHCNVPGRNTKLGRWVTSQRGLFRMGKLSHDRLQLLNDIGFEWRQQRYRQPSTMPLLNDAQFENVLIVMHEYIKFQGHGWVPQCTPEVSNLGNWAQHLRTQKRQGTLSNSRLLALENIGFVWEKQPSICSDDETFEEMLLATTEYIRIQGHGWIPKNSPGFPKLGNWARTQRDQKRTKQLSPAKQLALECIGFVWEAPSTPSDAFEIMLNATAEFIRVQGHGWVPQQTPELPTIGKWAHTQRELEKAGKLSESRHMALERVGFVWEVSSSSKFEAMLQLVAEYIRIQGNGWVPSRTPKDPKIGKWAQNQRHNKQKGKLSTSRQLALERIGFAWEAPILSPSFDAKFEAMLRVAAEYIRVEQTGWIPMRITEFPKLGPWARTQRKQKRAGKLSTLRQLALERIGFVWEGANR